MSLLLVLVGLWATVLPHGSSSLAFISATFSQYERGFFLVDFARPFIFFFKPLKVLFKSFWRSCFAETSWKGSLSLFPVRLCCRLFLYCWTVLTGKIFCELRDGYCVSSVSGACVQIRDKLKFTKFRRLFFLLASPEKEVSCHFPYPGWTIFRRKCYWLLPVLSRYRSVW